MPGKKLPSCFTCATRERCELAVLDERELTRLNRLKVCNNYRPGQMIFHQGSPCLGIHCIGTGTVALRRTDALGNSMLLRLVSSHQTLGYRSYFGGGNHAASAEAISPCRICFLERGGMARLLDSNPTLGRSFLARMALDLRSADEARMNATNLSVRARMVHLLLMLRHRFASVGEDGSLRFDLPLSRRDIASIVGTRPETVARVIRSLEADGVTHFQGRRVVVPDLDLLLDEVEALEGAA